MSIPFMRRGYRNIHQDKIDLALVQYSQRLFCRLNHAHNFKIWLPGQETLERVCKPQMVFDEQDRSHEEVTSSAGT